MNDFLAKSNQEELNEIIAQMEKELNMAGEKYTFKSDQAESLIIELSEFLNQLNNNRKVKNILYRIDVEGARTNLDSGNFHSLSLAMWDRVFKKVWFRKRYKGD